MFETMTNSYLTTRITTTWIQKLKHYGLTIVRRKRRKNGEKPQLLRRMRMRAIGQSKAPVDPMCTPLKVTQTVIRSDHLRRLLHDHPRLTRTLLHTASRTRTTQQQLPVDRVPPTPPVQPLAAMRVYPTTRCTSESWLTTQEMS